MTTILTPNQIDPSEYPGNRLRDPAIKSPIPIFDHIRTLYNLKNDSALARFLDMPAPLLSKIRAKVHGISPEIMSRIHLITGIPIRELRAMEGVVIPDQSTLLQEAHSRASKEGIQRTVNQIASLKQENEQLKQQLLSQQSQPIPTQP